MRRSRWPGISAQPADRAVRRQRNLDRWRDVAVMLGRPARAVQGLGLVGQPDRRPRSRSDCGRDRARAHSDRPSLIACRTVIGFGAPNRQGTEKIHGAPLGAEETAKTRAALDWPHPPFEIPESVAGNGASIGARGQAARHSWIERTRRAQCRSALAVSRCAQSQAAVRLCRGDDAAPRSLRSRAADIATRQASQRVIDAHRRGVAQSARRLGRSHAFQPDARQDPAAGAARLPLTAATFTMASASTPWRRR